MNVVYSLVYMGKHRHGKDSGVLILGNKERENQNPDTIWNVH